MRGKEREYVRERQTDRQRGALRDRQAETGGGGGGDADIVTNDRDLDLCLCMFVRKPLQQHGRHQREGLQTS